MENEQQLYALLKSGIISSAEELKLFLDMHDESYYPNDDDTEKVFRIHLTDGYCEIHVKKSTTFDPDTLMFEKYTWQDEPIPIHFFDYDELRYDNYHELLWHKVMDESVIMNYKLCGYNCTVQELRNLSKEFYSFTDAEYYKKFLRERKMILNSYLIDHEPKTLYCFFQILDDCDPDTQSWDELKKVQLQITSTKLE